MDVLKLNNTSMTVTFRAKMDDGYSVKILFELLQNIIKTACLEIDTEGIHLRMMDSNRRILTNIDLHAKNCNVFFIQRSPMYIGVNIGHLYKMLKLVKKKNGLTLYLDDESPHTLFLEIDQKEENRLCKSSIQIQTIQHIRIPLPETYDSFIIIPSADYQRTLKDMNTMGDTLQVKMKKASVSFSCSAENVYSREIVYGIIDDCSEEEYNQFFDMDQFIRFIKISGLSKNIYLHRGSTQRPLLLKTKVGSLGDLSIYVKSKAQIRMDQNK